MEIRHAYPPNYKQVAKVFGRNAISNAVFTYGNTIYSPRGNPIAGHLLHHEQVHMKQQRAGAEEWWHRYLVDPEFRLSQELEAYREQYKFIKTNYGREDRRVLLKHIVKDIASPMYGSMITKELAKQLITEG